MKQSDRIGAAVSTPKARRRPLALVSFATAPRLCRLRVSLRICLYISIRLAPDLLVARSAAHRPLARTLGLSICSVSSPVRSVDAPVL